MNNIKNILPKICENNKQLPKEVTLKYENNIVHVSNSSKKLQKINVDKLFFTKIEEKFLEIENIVILKKGEAYFSILDNVIPLNSNIKISLSLLNRYYYDIKLYLKPNTELTLSKLVYFLVDQKKIEETKSTSDTLVISPGYPNSSNLYAFSFVHTSTKGYLDAGLNVQVFCPNSANIKYEYKFEELTIISDSLEFLKKLINNSNYKRIILHYIDEKLVEIIESVAFYYGIKIYIYPNENEILYRYQEKLSTGYNNIFCPNYNPWQIFTKDLIFKKLSKNINFTWVFRSNWLKDTAEEVIKTKFADYKIIPNNINASIFKYHEKIADDRLNIFIIKKFDNTNNYALDLILDTILILSNKDFFQRLNFNIYGDGPLFKEFASKLSNFSSVKFIQGFPTSTQISKLHKNHGIIFHPSRLDDMFFSSLEAISSGLVLVGSNVAAISEFIDNDHNILSNDIENPVSYANIIEDLYNNPDKFLALSEKLAQEISTKCSYSATLNEELELFKNEKPFYALPSEEKILEKLLSICVPAYNIEKYITRALNSILSCENKHLLEVIIINDGSTDNTLNIACQYQEKFSDVVTIIDQKNKGHGSAIIAGIKHATGKYFKIIDGDDWVRPEDLDKFLLNIKNFDVDLFLTEVACDNLSKSNFTSYKLYNHLPEKKIIKFEKIKFSNECPILATSTCKTSILKNLNLQIPEKCFYVDMKLNAYVISAVKNVVYFDIFLYKYFIGRDAQSTSLKTFKNKYHDHELVIFDILNLIGNELQLNDLKKKLIINKLLLPMIVVHFVNLIVHYKMYKASFQMYIKLRNYPKTLNNKVKFPIILPVINAIIPFLTHSIIQFGNILLLFPYNFAKYSFQFLNKHNIEYFNDYADIIGKTLLLPHTIISKTLLLVKNTIKLFTQKTYLKKENK